MIEDDVSAGRLLVESPRDTAGIDPPELQRIQIAGVMVEPQTRLERIGKVAYDVSGIDRYLRPGYGVGTGEYDTVAPLDIRADGRRDEPVEITVSNDSLESHRSVPCR